MSYLLKRQYLIIFDCEIFEHVYHDPDFAFLFYGFRIPVLLFFANKANHLFPGNKVWISQHVIYRMDQAIVV